MSSLINSLKSEIARVARKELKQELLTLRQTAATHRSEIAALKRQVKLLASNLGKVAKATNTRPKASPAVEEKAASPGIRFSAARLIKLRTKFGITQAKMALLLGVSYLSVYKWEKGASQPRAAQIQKIASVAQLGKREVQKKLHDMGESQ